MTQSCRQAWFRLRAALLSMLVTAAAGAGCSSAPALRVATSGDYPPFSVTTPYGANIGFDVDVAAQFTRDTGRGMFFVPLVWPQLTEQADADGFDIAMSGVTIRADRLPHMLFSRPYAVTGAVVAVRRERADELGTLARIDRPGVRLAVNRGGHLERVARARFVHATILTVDDNRALADHVLRDEVDGAVSDDIEVRAWPVETFAVIGPFTRDRKAYATTPERTELLRELNRWLAARESDGWLNGERSRWLSPAAVWTADDACFEAIAVAIDLRLLLMPRVAAAKRQRNMPIEDPVQEEKVLGQAAEWASDEGLDSEAIVALFARLIAAAKNIQASVSTPAALLDPVDLDALRRAIGFYSRSLVEEIGRCRFTLARADAPSKLESALLAGESFGGDDSSLAKDLALLLTLPPRPALAAHDAASQKPDTVFAAPVEPGPEIATAAEPDAGTYVEFCIPPNLRFDHEGYSAEEIADGLPLLSVPKLELRSGRTRVPVSPGRHEYLLYVNGSSGDPRRAQGAEITPSKVAVNVPQGRVVGIRYTPEFSASGEFELHWQDVYGAAAGGLETYRGLTRFDIDVAVSAPALPEEPSECPW